MLYADFNDPDFELVSFNRVVVLENISLEDISFEADGPESRLSKTQRALSSLPQSRQYLVSIINYWQIDNVKSSCHQEKLQWKTRELRLGKMLLNFYNYLHVSNIQLFKEH